MSECGRYYTDPDRALTAEELDAVAFILNCVDAVGPEQIASALRDAGYGTDSTGLLVEKVGFCADCARHCFVELEPRSGDWLCLACRVTRFANEAEISPAAGGIPTAGDVGACGRGAGAWPAPVFSDIESAGGAGARPATPQGEPGATDRAAGAPLQEEAAC